MQQLTNRDKGAELNRIKCDNDNSPFLLQGEMMETYKDLLNRKPKETPATVTIDGVEAALDYSLERYGTIIACYEEAYTHNELSWLRSAETVELTGSRRYHDGDNQSGVSSTIELVWRQGAEYTANDSITHYYRGESRHNALKQMERIVTAYRAAIDAIGNSDNPDFEAELDAAVTEHVTGGEAE